MEIGLFIIVIFVIWVIWEILPIVVSSHSKKVEMEAKVVESETEEEVVEYIPWSDPYDNKIIEKEPVTVKITFPDGYVVIAIKKENLEKIIKHGLPKGSMSFVRGNMYFVDINGISTIPYKEDYNPETWNIWDVPFFKQIFAKYDDLYEEGKISFELDPEVRFT